MDFADLPEHATFRACRGVNLPDLHLAGARDQRISPGRAILQRKIIGQPVLAPPEG